MAKGKELTEEQINANAAQHVPELVKALRALLDGMYEADEHFTTDGELHEDSRKAWVVWRKIAGDNYVPDDILRGLRKRRNAA